MKLKERKNKLRVIVDSRNRNHEKAQAGLTRNMKTKSLLGLGDDDVKVLNWIMEIAFIINFYAPLIIFWYIRKQQEQQEHKQRSTRMYFRWANCGVWKLSHGIKRAVMLRQTLFQHNKKISNIKSWIKLNIYNIFREPREPQQSRVPKAKRPTATQ